MVDIDTDAPIAGAVVIATYSSSSASPAGMLSKEIDAQETLTDANGEFVLPEVAVGGTKYSGYLEGRLKIFKPGYGAFPSSPRKLILLCRDDKGQWIEDCPMEHDKYMLYKLPKLNTIEERKENVPTHSSFIPPEKQRLLIQAIIEERSSLGYKSMPTLPK
ncbi:MAG: carboxypeptidase-like regulatory domain-containing protein [Desulfobulbaceae bacterium]